MAQIFAAAVKADVPKAALQYEGEECRLLVAVCRELQCAAGTGPFFLSCRTAAKLFDVDHSTAWRWLFLLEQDGVIEVVSKGSQATKRASRYRYIASD